MKTIRNFQFEASKKSIHSKRNNFANIDLPGNTIFFKYTAFSPKAFTEFIKYETTDKKNDRNPYFKNCLYWNTKLKKENTKTEYSFYASDHCAEYDIIYRCITKEGKVFEQQKTIEIRKQRF